LVEENLSSEEMPKEEEEEIVEVSKFSGKTIIHKKE
jgi:hypothetical protein